ncbi:hypothetical protein BGZ83_007020 [Gryganskiella cystojenkinii]|nr:hypothetical protein BGZ83_007020 [Gryganskiella cystojenkinii]
MLDGFLATGQTTQLQDLVLETVNEDEVMLECHYQLVRNSPNLVRLLWRTMEKDDPSVQEDGVSTEQWDKLSSAILDGACPWKRLESLALPGIDITAYDFEVVIKALAPTLKDLNFETSNFDRSAWYEIQSIAPLRTTLRTLNLRGCIELKGDAVHDIMSTMTGLESFQAEWICDSDILGKRGGRELDEVDQKPWVCTRMKELAVGMVVHSYDDYDDEDDISFNDRELHLMKLLSQLTELETLNLTIGQEIQDRYPESLYYDGDDPNELGLTLEGGLDSLKTLKKLRILELSTFAWSGQEARWILDSWPRLEKIVGPRIEDPEAQSLLKDTWMEPAPR